MAPAPPPPPKAHCGCAVAPVSLFLDTDLGTRLALLVGLDTTIRGLKSQVAAEHSAAFPDLGPVAVKSFQVRRKGVLYHLSDSMTVTSAFTRIKGGCFLHVKMAEAATHCCQCTPAIGGRRLSDDSLGIHVEKHVRELPATTSEIASDVLPQRLQGVDAATALNSVHAHDAVPCSSQLNNEMKENKAVGLASDAEVGSDPVIDEAKSRSHQMKHANQTEGAYISSTSMVNVNKSSNQCNTPHVVEEVLARKEDIFHGHGDHDVGGNVSDSKQVRIEEEMLEEIHAMDNLSQEKEHKKARGTCSFDKSSADPSRRSNEPDAGDMTKSSGAPLETSTTSHGEPLNTSSPQEVHDTLHEESIQLENPSTLGKKKRKRRRLPFSGAASAQETVEPSAGVAELSKSTGDDAQNVELTGRDETVVNASGLPLSSSEFNDGNQGAKHVQFVSNAQASTDLISEQEKFDHAPKGYRNSSIGDAINSTAEVVASEGKTTKGSSAPWDGGEKHEGLKQHNEGSHDEGVAETSYMEKDGKSTDALEKRQRNDNISQEKKRKKAKKVTSVDMVSMDTTGGKEMHGYRENAAKSDTVSTKREIVRDPSAGQISNIVSQGDSNITANPSGDGKKNKKRRHHSESSKGVDPSQDLTKSSGFLTNESLIQCIDASPPNEKQTQGSVEGATISDHKKHGESLDMVATNVIDEVLADLRSKDSLSRDLDGDMLTGQTHLGSNQNALELPESNEDKVGVSAALPPKCPAAVHSDAPVSSPRHKKSKGKHLKVLSTMIESSHHSSGVPKEDANTKLKESDSLKFSDKTSDLKDTLTGDVVAQADDKTKATKRQKKKLSLKQVPTDDGKTSNEQVKQVATLDLKGVDATQESLVQGGSVVGTPSSTVGKVQKGKRSSKTRTPKIQETNDSTHGQDSHLAKDSQDECATDIIGTQDNEIAAGAPTELPKDTLTGDVVAQADDKTKSTKRQRKVSSKQVPIDDGKTLDEQVNQVATLDLKGVDATQAKLVQGGSVIDTPSSTVGKAQQKVKRSSKTRTPKIQETNHSTHGQDSHLAKDSQDEYATDIIGTHDNEIAAGAPTELPVVQKDSMTLKSASPNARKERKKPSNTELQSQDSALEHGSSADLVNSRTEKGQVSPKNSADAVKPNCQILVHPATDEINFLDHFSSSEMNDPSVSAENKQNNVDENLRVVKNKKEKRKQGTGSIGPNGVLEFLLPTDKTSLTGHFGTREAVVPSVTAENMNREDENVKNGKEKKKRKRKANMEVPAAEKKNPNCDNQGTDIGTQDSLLSVVQKGRMGQGNGKESNNKVTQNASIMQNEPEDATCDHTVEKRLHQSDVDGQNNMPTDKDHGHISKEVRKSTSQTKPHAKSRNHDESSKGRNPKAVSNLVKSFSMSPPASSDSTDGTPQNANRYRVAVRKVPSKRYEQTSEISKKESRKVGSSATFNDAMSEGSDDELDTKRKNAAMEASPDNSSTSADSGISSAAYDESEVPDDDGTVSLSQKSLKDGLHIGSILRGSSSYKKARQKQTELLDDDTEVPDSQPADGLWD